MTNQQLDQLIQVFSNINDGSPWYHFVNGIYSNGRNKVQLGFSWPIEEGFIRASEIKNNLIVLNELKTRMLDKDYLDTFINLKVSGNRWTFTVITRGRTVYSDFIRFTDSSRLMTWALRRKFGIRKGRTIAS